MSVNRRQNYMDSMRVICFLFCLQTVLTAGAARDADAIVGAWEADNKKDIVHIKIERDGEIYSGTIVWIEEKFFPPDDPRGMGGKPKTDRNNPDPALRTRPIVGLAVVGGLRYAGRGEWKGGWIYAPDRGRKARCKAKLTPHGTLRVRGFIGHPLFGSSLEWRRVEPR